MSAGTAAAMRARSARPRRLRWRQCWQSGWRLSALVLLLGVHGCGSGESNASPAASASAANDGDTAKRWLLPASLLPPRAEVVAVSDRLNITASRADAAADKARLSLLAAQLRERLWRFDQRDTDGREALELYRQAREDGRGSALACTADRKRALLFGEIAHDASQLYKELYLAIERQDAARGQADPGACLGELRRSLDSVSAYRPTGLAWQALTAEAARVHAANQPKPASTAAAAATGSGSAQPAASGSGAVPVDLAAGKVQDIVVHPDAAMVAVAGAKLADVQTYNWERGARVVLALDAPANYQLGVLAPDPKAGRGHRVYLDLLNTRAKKKFKAITADGIIQGLRFGKRKGGLRVVLDLSQEANRRVFYLPNPFRVVIDVGSRNAAVSRPQGTPPSSAANTPQPIAQRRLQRITLDPGHGGWDSGAVGPTGLQEKDVALDVAHRAAPALATELGIETMLTRDSDTFVPLEERTARANAFQSDLFVSIHCNATENGQAQGVEVFILDPSREMDKRHAQVVARENRASARHAGGSHIDEVEGVGSHVASIAAGLGNDAAASSRQLARLLLRSTMASLQTRYPNTRDHGVKTAGFFVLLGADMPAALYETAFISNPDDERRLATADFRQKLADAIVNAVRAFREGHR